MAKTKASKKAVKKNELDEAFNEFYGRDTAGMVEKSVKASFDVAGLEFKGLERQLKECVALSKVLGSPHSFRLCVSANEEYSVSVERVK